jgi:shikimate kinase
LNTILFGFKGSGKTHLGRLWAQEKGMAFFDSDERMILLDGRGLSIRELYQQLGEEPFRALEKRALFSFQGVTHSVIALGGGAILDSESLLFLQALGSLVFIDASLELILERGISIPGQDIRALYAKRRPLYEAIHARRIYVG